MLAAAPAAFAGEAPVEPPDARFNRAERLYASGELEKAYELYESVGKADPGRWGARTGARMTEIKKLVTGREEARARAKHLVEAAAGEKGSKGLAPWLLCEAARGLLEARLPEETKASILQMLDAHPDSPQRVAALLILARANARLGRVDDAVSAYKQAVGTKGASRAERADCWKELGELLSGANRMGEYRDMLEAQVRRGPEEPGAEEAAERFLSLAMAGPKEALRAGRLAGEMLESWPAGAVHPEWVALAGKIAEFVERDYAKAERLYRVVLDRYPQAAFDLRLLENGRGGADAGKAVLLADIQRAADKRAGKIKELEVPSAEERGKTPEKALAAVLGALKAGDTAAAKAAAGGALAAQIDAGNCDFARYGLSDFKLGASRKEGDGVEVDYEVSGELGVTRVLKKKARAGSEDGVWKITDLGL